MLAKISINRPVTTIMLLLMVILAGLVALLGLKMDLMPSVDVPIAIVSTSYTGAGPREVQELISKPIEQALATVSNVDEITTISNDGSSLIVLQFVDGTDLDMAALDVREKVDLIKQYLPDGANEPMVMKIDPSAMNSIYVGVRGGKNLIDLQNTVEEKIENRIERIRGVASVSSMGGLQEEIEILIKPEKLAGYGVTEAQIISHLAAENLNLPSGTLVQGNLRLQVRSVGEFKTIEDIQNLPITTPTGAVLRLSDLAKVSRVTAEPSSHAIIDGESSIAMVIQKQSNANIVDVSNELNKELEKIKKDFPDLTFTVLVDTAEYIKLSIKNVLKTLMLACILAIIVLFVFLKNIKASAIIAVSIPTSVIATFALMYVSNTTLNIISLGGLTIGIGMLVDNSIVVLESIFKKRDDGMSSFDAALKGTTEVAMAIAASTATTCAVFIPLIFIKGMIGQIFRDLSLTICFSLAASLVVSLTFVPMAASRMLRYDNTANFHYGKRFKSFLDNWEKWLESFEIKYKGILQWALGHRKTVIFITLAAFILTLSITPLLGATFLPEMDQGEIIISATMPSGTLLEENLKTSEKILAEINDIPEIDFTFAYVGAGEMSMMMSTNADSATVYIVLVDLEKRIRSSKEIAAQIRERLKNIAGAEIAVTASESAMGSYSSSDLSFRLNGTDTGELKRIGEDVVSLISQQVEGATEVKSSAGKAIPEANITVNREKAALFGISAASVASAVNTAISGRVATQYKINGTEIDIRVKYGKDDMEFLTDVKNIYIPSPRGGGVPLAEIADVSLKDGPVSITRINQQESITIEASLQNKSLNVVQAEIKKIMDNYKLPEGYSYEFTGDIESMQDSFYSLLIVLVVAILLVYMIIASQFESLLNPFIIMFSIPLALTGGLFALFVTRTQISVPALMGFIMLVGMVVNNAIVLIDYTGKLRSEGSGCTEALLISGQSRLRPILMTTLTTIIGLFPMAMASGSGTELTRDLSIVAIGGLTLSTVVTLVFIPVLYYVFDNFRNKRKAKKQAKRQVSGSIEIKY